ncbi:MAG TPA: twin-arginine translocase TatA/TatE family subunit [Thermodesulfobacteriota bacterium]|nr:twin-arginine translocase TatA/TatE family subunit [Thermodesulfobacteriota bacterium]
MLSGPDVLVVLVIALFVFGPQKLPELAKSLGKAMREFKKASEEVRLGFQEEVRKVEERSSHPASRDPAVDSLEKVSEPLPLPERMGEVSSFGTESLSDK